MSSLPVFCGVRVAYIFTFCVVILCVFTFWVPCCDVRYDFHMEAMFGLDFPPVVCGGLVSCLCYLFRICLSLMVSSAYCVVFLLCFSSSFVPYVASFS